jgi:hypothetical protein
MTRRLLVVASLVVSLFVVLAGTAPLPTTAAATGIDGVAVGPSPVPTGEPTTLSFEANVTGVDTGDGTTGATVRFRVADSVELSGATVDHVSVAPNATGISATVDADAGTVSVTWTDDGGSASETLSVAVAVTDAVATRSGSTDVTATVDADATGGAELTATVGSVTAVASDSDRSVAGDRATLYLGERGVDVTGLTGANPAGEPQRFYGVAGEAEGVFASADDALAVDVTPANGFEPGSYALSSTDGEPRVTVSRPAVTDVTLFSGDSASGADVTNGSIPRGEANVTVTVEFPFDDAENATVSVEDEDGLDVTTRLTDAPVVSTSGGSVTLDVRSLDTGRYEVTAEGADDLDAASETVSLRVRDSAKVITLSRTSVVRGDSSVVSIAGAPGDVRYVRIHESALRDGTTTNVPTARAVFDDTEQVRTVGADADLGYVYAVVSLDDDGFADIRLRTDRLRTEMVDVALASAVDAVAEDEVSLDVSARTLSVASPEPTVVGETVTVSGTAPESDRVKLYAAVSDAYVPLSEDAAAGTLAESDVGSDGTWTADVDTSAVVDLPGAYQLVAVGDPGSERLGSTDPIDAETLRTLDPRDTTALTTVEGELSLSVSRTTIAATGSDEFDLSGVAVGQSELRLYRVGPRGDVEARTVDPSADGFVETIDGLETRGVHTFVVVGDGRDGQYTYADGAGPSADDLLSGRETRPAALAKLDDAYTRAGADDPVARVDVTAAEPTLSVRSPGRDGPITATTTTVSGRSTGEDGSTVFVELLGSDGTTVRFAETTVTNGSWNATLDLAGVSPGTYRLVADDGRASDSLAVTLTGRTPSATPSPTPRSTPGEGESTTAGGSSAVPGTTTSPPAVTAPASESTTTRFPGFGPPVAVAAVGSVLVVLALRPRSGDGGWE